jgi:cell division protein FtsW
MENTTQESTKRIFYGDRWIWMVVLVLSVISVLSVYSSNSTIAHRFRDGNFEFYLFKHLGLILSGLFFLYLVHFADYRFFSRVGQIALWISIPLLLVTLITGTSVNSAQRWLSIPIINATFQTSDLAKLALMMYLARQLSKKQETIKDFKSGFLPLIIPIGLVCLLILPANFSTAAIVFATSLVLLFIGRVNMKYIFSLIGIGLLSFGLFLLIALNFNLPGRIGTWKQRIENFTSGSGEGNYQANNAKMAIANGGLFGLGPGNSRQRNFLPQSESDYIYATVIEEYGLIGGIVVMLMYLILFYRVMRMIRFSPNSFATFLAVGCMILLVFQAFINMAVATGLFPVTGQTLPLVSAGGTSIWFTSIAIGIIINISRHCVQNNSEGGQYA